MNLARKVVFGQLSLRQTFPTGKLVYICSLVNDSGLWRVTEVVPRSHQNDEKNGLYFSKVSQKLGKLCVNFFGEEKKTPFLTKKVLGAWEKTPKISTRDLFILLAVPEVEDRNPLPPQTKQNHDSHARPFILIFDFRFFAELYIPWKWP